MIILLQIDAQVPLGDRWKDRLERLEEQIMPLTVRKVWQIITVNPDGTKEPTGITIEWPSRPTPDRQQGTSLRAFHK